MSLVLAKAHMTIWARQAKNYHHHPFLPKKVDKFTVL
jgi:hypothetical protein